MILFWCVNVGPNFAVLDTDECVKHETQGHRLYYIKMCFK